MNLKRLPLVIWSILLSSSPGIGILSVEGVFGDEAPQEEHESAQYSLAGMWENRERLESGDVRATLIRTSPIPNGMTPETVLHRTINCAFDFPRRRFRFDASDKFKLAAGGFETRGYRYLQVEDTVYTYQTQSGKISKRALGDSENDTFNTWFDVRAVGLLNRAEMDSNIDYMKRKSYLSQLSIVHALRDSTERYEVTLGHVSRPELRHKVVVDSKNGFSSVQFEDLLNTPKGSTNWIVRTYSKTEWTNTDDVWLPKKWEGSDTNNDKDVMTFDWVSVNKTIDPKSFDIDAIAFPEGTSVIDFRLGKPVIVDVINPPRLGEDEARLTSRGAFLPMWIVLVASPIIVVAAFAYWRSRKSAFAHHR